MSVSAFNDYVAQQNASASSVTLTFDVTGVDLDDYLDTKGWLAELADGTCSKGVAASLKVYGSTSQDGGALAHPPGTVKLEHGSQCCASPPCVEHWADPNPGPVIFTGPTQVCAIKVVVDPTRIGYEIKCDATVFPGDGPNDDALTVNKVALLSEVAGGHAMKNAKATNDQVCFELKPSSANTQKLPVLEDVTVSPESPNAVVQPDTDLGCGTTDGSIYLKFAVASPLGKVKSARVFLRSAPGSSAAGDGGDLFFVADNGWSEKTLTFSKAPSTTPPALGRIEQVVPGQWYSVDVTARVQAKGTFSFALVPRSTDQNGAHFLSKEASSTLAPYLAVEYSVVDADKDGTPDGPDCNDSDPSVNPGAAEKCNGADDNCDGTVDEGCGPGADGGKPDGGAGGAGGGTGGAGHGASAGDAAGGATGTAGAPGSVFTRAPAEDAGGCGCAVPGRGPSGWGNAVAGLLGAGLLRRRRDKRSRDLVPGAELPYSAPA
jgi:MYXO-CTERM domain-containing protein